jgi:methylmalonyl-CoA/ethylmalonyl-CoA epimerase
MPPASDPLPAAEAAAGTANTGGAVGPLRAHHFGISVPDLDAAPASVAFVRRGDFRIEIFQVEGAAPLPEDRRTPNRDLKTHGNKHLCFEVPDVPAAIARLRAQGADIAFETVVEGNSTAFVRDCAGNLIEFLQPFPEHP